ncbi:serine hydrolase domain-containing protein [Lysobacter sp. A03]|uniref:serine hydrolase domain-containing protein n=1 Tax=Lysobacter sp. A03 TaxID=1199154 RepID=UPI0005B6E179|nr:serine hydrolase domain-containing protein [Lysobacter sp. A03]KIQ96582.1 Beta-lactamase [Lysobacter sp. A03]
MLRMPSRNFFPFPLLGGIFIAAILGACAMTSIPSDPPAEATDQTASVALEKKIDQLMNRYAGSGPGASLLVVRAGEPPIRRSYGMADVEKAVPVSPATNFRLASVSKQFTAAAILLLLEDGRLTLEDPVRKWLPELPAATTGITIRHLLTHVSGLIDYEDEMSADLDRQVHDADVLQILAKLDRTYFPPGSDFRYSNSAYALLALIVERISGEEYPAFLQKRIFQPLGMSATLAFVDGGPAVENRAYGYSGEDGAWVRTDQSPTSAVLGDGGIYSSIDDLAKWNAALEDDRLLSGKSRALAFTAAVSTHDPGVEYGLGWYIGKERGWHSGETIGFRNVIVRYPQQGLAVVILSNRNNPEPMETALAIAALFQQ